VKGIAKANGTAVLARPAGLTRQENRGEVVTAYAHIVCEQAIRSCLVSCNPSVQLTLAVGENRSLGSQGLVFRSPAMALPGRPIGA